MQERFTLQDYQGLCFRLDFYETDIIATRFGHTAMSYRVNEKDVVSAFSQRHFSLPLPRNTVLVAQRGTLHAIVVLVPAAEHALFVDYGKDNLAQFTIPLPPLLFSLSWRKDRIEDIHILALKTNEWPGPEDRLCVAPLPNVSSSTGRLCLGQLHFDRPRLPEGAHSIYQLVMASPFSNHDLDHKSKAFPDNVLYQWHALHEQRASCYPPEDLVETAGTLKAYLDQFGNSKP